MNADERENDKSFNTEVTEDTEKRRDWNRENGCWLFYPPSLVFFSVPSVSSVLKLFVPITYAADFPQD
jgi:hypothetical protein